MPGAARGALSSVCETSSAVRGALIHRGRRSPSLRGSPAIRTGVRAGLLALALAGPVAAQSPPAARLARIDSLARGPIEQGTAAGMVIFAVHRGDTVLARAYGRADLENDVPMRTDQVFQLASITKQFTAAAVLALVAEGRVELDAPITRYLPEAPVQGRPVTVRQLLSHTSGVVDYAESPRLRSLKALDLPPDSLLAVVAGTPFYFPPGEQMRYSNTGYVLLGQLIERVGGRPYAEFVTERVLRPAGAVGTHFCEPRRVVPRLARGYTMSPAGVVPAEYISPHVPYAAGGFCGTAGDLAAWNAALHGGRLLPAAVYAEMVRAPVVSGRTGRYGLGMALSEIGGRRAYHHGGDIFGFTTHTAYFPDDSLNVTVLVNTQGPARADAMVAAVADAVLGARPPAAAPPTPDLAPLAGVYGGDAAFEVVDSDSGPALRLKRGPLPEVVLRYAGEWTFTDGHRRYTFVRGSGPRAATVWADLGVSLVRWEREP